MRSALTFRVFVSSTFEDLRAERDALHARVFPRLSERCAARGARFQPIDLRWGVSAEAALDQQTMNICLEEVRRCRSVSPRPNFVVLLGERYGWRPPPPQVPADVLEAAAHRLGARGTALLEWYKRDDNAVPPERFLLPRTGRFADPAVWAPVEAELRALLTEGLAGTPAADDVRYAGSASEQEIALGALSPDDAREHVFCFFRTIEGLPAGVGPPLREVDAEGAERLVRLRERLRTTLAGNVHEYTERWTGGGLAGAHLGALCDDVEQRLGDVIDAELARREREGPVVLEARAHAAFAEERAQHFSGREDVLARIREYVAGDEPVLLAVAGQAGAGKSALLARAAHEAGEARPGAVLMTRFIGATAASTDVTTLLASVCRELAAAYEAGDAEASLPYESLVEDLPRRFALATAERPLLVFLDALDQLTRAEDAQWLAWLPFDLPPHVRLVVSAGPGDSQWVLRSSLRGHQMVDVPAMTVDEGASMLDRVLRAGGRCLQPAQRAAVLEAFAPLGSPLYLRLAAEEARRWRSDEAPPPLGADVAALVRDNLLARLEAPGQHGPLLVARALGLLGAARNGLSEDELVEILGADPDVLEDFNRRSPYSPDSAELPVAVWSRLLSDLAPYLGERLADGATLLVFFHRELAAVARERYLGGEDGRERHRALARHFATTPHVPRRLAELPYQQARGQMWDALIATLTDFRFLEDKAAVAGGVSLLLEDIRFALRCLPGGPDEDVDLWGPLILTARREEHGLFAQCPFCETGMDPQAEHLGQTFTCPGAGCEIVLRLNEFVLEELPL
jgi:NACHT domain- and WD repeat-containing protein